MKRLTLYLRHKRLEKNKTIEDMAKAIGISCSTYSCKERCINQFNVNEIKVVADELGLSKNDIANHFFD